MNIFFAATNADAGNGVNLLPIVVVVLVALVAVVVWKRRSGR
jgi:hypothetical protein